MPDQSPRRLTKREVERLMDSYDADPVASLTEALTSLVATSHGTWEQLVGALPVPSDVRARLLGRDTAAMDDFVKNLVEFRALEE